MKTLAEITHYYKTKLHQPLINLEKQRIKIKKRVNTQVSIILFFTIFINFVIAQKFQMDFLFYLVFTIISIALAYSLTSKHYTKSYISEFKDKILIPLVKYVDKSLIYKKEKHIDIQTYQESKVQLEAITNYKGSDFLYGNINGVNVKSSELVVSHRKHGESELSFWGLFVKAEFPKHFQAHTIIHRKTSPLLQAHKLSDEYEHISMDSPLFNKEFIVYSTDAIEARYILSLTLMERLIEYTKEVDFPTTISFVKGNIYLLNQCGEVLEPSLQKSLLRNDVAKSYALSLSFSVNLVAILHLNDRLWSKY